MLRPSGVEIETLHHASPATPARDPQDQEVPVPRDGRPRPRATTRRWPSSIACARNSTTPGRAARRRTASGPGAKRFRWSDDGEPGGSAGKPILQALEEDGI